MGGLPSKPWTLRGCSRRWVRLATRDQLDISAFVDSWSSDILEVDRDTDAGLSSIAGRLRKEIVNVRFQNDTQAGSSAHGFYLKNHWKFKWSRISDSLRHMIIALRDILTVESHGQVAYLSPLADLAHRQPGGLMVATLNYDLTVEKMCAASNADFGTGLLGWTGDGRWVFPKSGISLLKLHGSINCGRVRCRRLQVICLSNR